MPIDSGSGWYVYNPAYNAPLTAAELDLNRRLQSGDAILRDEYIAKYGTDLKPSPMGPTPAWHVQWSTDQDYWNARYLNQLAPPEEMRRLQGESITPQGYPYSIHHMNAIKQMIATGTAEQYFAGFRDQNLAGYLAAVVGISLTGKQNDLTVGLQPPTFTPTTVGQGPTVDYTPPAISGPIPPSPTTTGIQGPTTVQPPAVSNVTPSPSGSATASPGQPAGTTQPPTATLVPNQSAAPMPTPTSLIQPQQNMLLWVVGGIALLAVVIWVARK